MTEKTDILGTLFLIMFAAIGLLLIVFFLPLFLVVLKIVGMIACLLVGLVLLLALVFGIFHLILIPYYALKTDKKQPYGHNIYEGTYRVEDARDAGEDEKKGRL